MSGGVRVAQFGSKSDLTLGADVVANFVPNVFQKYHYIHEFDSEEKRSFHGIGPELNWDASVPISGKAEDGAITFDWGANAAVLFGRQSVSLHHESSSCLHGGLFATIGSCASIVTHDELVKRSRRVTVPNLGGYIGASVRYQNAKISFGYRADEFFNAIDGGQATAKKENRGLFGPYLNLSIGLGG